MSGIHSVQRVLRILVSPAPFSPNGVGYLPCNLSNGVRPSRPFWHLDKMLPACSTNHGKIGESSRSSSCVQLSTCHSKVLMTPRNNIAAFSTNPFEGLSPLTASSSVTSALRFSVTWFLNAIIASSVSLFNVISSYHKELMNLATLSLAQCSPIPFFRTTLLTNVQMSVLLYHNARH